MKKNILISIICLLVFLNVNGQSHSINDSIKKTSFVDSNLLKHIKILSSDAFEGRRTETNGGEKAKIYIINQFMATSVLPLTKGYQQTFSFNSEGKHYNGVNVLGLIKGSLYPENYIVISAHYDHEGSKKGQIYNGADDNASGVSALFSFAEYFINNPPKHSVILAAFDAEELGLQGSKYFVSHSIIPSKQIMVNLNMDMISRSDKKELFAVGTAHNETLKKVIMNYTYSKKINLLTGHDEGNWKDNWTDASDHASFHKKGIPFLYFGVDDHEDYHEPTDDYENIQPEFYIEAVKVIIGVFEKIDVLTF
ncbi:M28 family peptidase [Mariniflexile litorale]|uniref:M28 family peptidase n=1 Tax=Mariniflexile litorale TaxID=3045158 RepID=A0AAU7EK23_9FLAO|nr:M28 family peptidase [Mariniflexile sp. KMM 9835]MDQ8211059.1 M28 family peptidase [Mariniflexile sp. KMM 9835]